MMIQKNVFGGPGNLQQSMMLMIQGWLQGQKEQEEKKESDLLAEILGKQQPEEAAPEDFYRQQTEELLASPLRPQSKAQGLQMLAGKRNLTTPEAAKDIKRIKLDFWDPQGKKRSMMVPEAAYSAVADKIVEGGGVLSEPKEEKWETKQAVLNGKPVFAQISDKGNTRLLNGNLEPIAQGLKFTMDKDGNITFAQGAGAAMTAPGNTPIGKETRNKLEKEAVDINEELSRLEGIATSLDDRFLTTSGKASAWWDNLKNMAGVELPDKDQRNLEEFSDFTRKTVENANLYIKRITGAQMSEAEAGRLMLAIPTFDSGWFSGDGPVKFKGKLKSVMGNLKMAKARHNYYLNKGLNLEDITSDKAISLGSMKDKIRSEGAEIEKRVRSENPNADDAAIKSKVAAELKKVFGL